MRQGYPTFSYRLSYAATDLEFYDTETSSTGFSYLIGSWSSFLQFVDHCLISFTHFLALFCLFISIYRYYCNHSYTLTYWPATLQFLFSIFGITDALDVWCIFLSFLSFCTPNPTSPSPLPLLSWIIKSAFLWAYEDSYEDSYESCSRFLFPRLQGSFLPLFLFLGQALGVLKGSRDNKNRCKKKKIFDPDERKKRKHKQNIVLVLKCLSHRYQLVVLY